MSRRFLQSFFVAALCLGVALSVAAQSLNVPFFPLPVFQGPPGARALGIGGAFIGVADDATAAEANPAGLTILSRPEVSIHVRHHDLGIAPRQLCTAGCGGESGTRPSFASYVQPFNKSALSIFYSSTFDFQPRVNLNAANAPSFFDPSFQSASFTESGPIKLRRYGLAGAFRPIPLLSIGAAVAVSRFEFNETSVESLSFIDDQKRLVSGDVRTRRTSKKSKLTYNVGVLLNPAGRISGGVVYRREGRYQAAFVNDIRACFCKPADAAALPFVPNTFGGPATGTERVPVPDFYGAGIAVRPVQRTLIAADYTVQRSTSFLSGKRQDIRGERIGAEYLIGTPNSNVFVPLRVGFAREHDPDFVNSDFFSKREHTYTVGTGVVVGNNEFDVAYGKGKTVTTGGSLKVLIFSGIHRF